MEVADCSSSEQLSGDWEEWQETGCRVAEPLHVDRAYTNTIKKLTCSYLDVYGSNCCQSSVTQINPMVDRKGGR